MTISDILGPRQSRTFGTITSAADPALSARLSFVRDPSRFGEYSVRLRLPDGSTQTVRMFLPSTMEVAEAAAAFEAWANTDVVGEPYTVTVTEENPLVFLAGVGVGMWLRGKML